MHQINLECVAYGYPNVTIFWKKAGDVNAERYIFDNRGVTKQVNQLHHLKQFDAIDIAGTLKIIEGQCIHYRSLIHPPCYPISFYSA